MLTSQYPQCRGCGKKFVQGRFQFCPDCMPLHLRLRDEHISIKGMNHFWACIRKYGRKCRYSGVSLEINDYTSPWYLVFSRLVPGDKNTIVPAAALFNAMKSALVERSFRRLVINLDDHRRKHLKVKRRPVPHWRPLEALGAEAECPVCGRKKARGRKYCQRCSKIVWRMKHERFSARNINDVLGYLHKYGFVDYYTGMLLVLDDPQSPWYLVFDHWRPHDAGRIVPTSALVNEMKGDLTEDEFWFFIRQLSNYFTNATPVRKRKLKCWCRHYR